MKNMIVRILTAAVGIPLMLGSMYAGGWIFSFLAMALAAVGIFEFYKLADAKGASPNYGVGIVGGLLVMLCTALFVDPAQVWGIRWLLSILPVIMAVGITTLAAEMWRNRPMAVFNVSTTLMGIVYVTLGFASLLYLRRFHLSGMVSSSADADMGFRFIMIMFAGVWMCDSLAYFVGMAIGKHKIFPRVSPKKSWEGSIAGCLASVGVFLGMTQWLMPAIKTHEAVICGVIVGVGGQLGDFAESWLKRDAAVKDSSQLIPGHGGVLDRFDSVLFVAPLLVVYATVLALLGMHR